MEIFIPTHSAKYQYFKRSIEPVLFHNRDMNIAATAIDSNAVVEGAETMLLAALTRAAVVNTRSKPMSELL